MLCKCEKFLKYSFPWREKLKLVYNPKPHLEILGHILYFILSILICFLKSFGNNNSAYFCRLSFSLHRTLRKFSRGRRRSNADNILDVSSFIWFYVDNFIIWSVVQIILYLYRLILGFRFTPPSCLIFYYWLKRPKHDHFAANATRCPL